MEVLAVFMLIDLERLGEELSRLDVEDAILDDNYFSVRVNPEESARILVRMWYRCKLSPENTLKSRE